MVQTTDTGFACLFVQVQEPLEHAVTGTSTSTSTSTGTGIHCSHLALSFTPHRSPRKAESGQRRVIVARRRLVPRHGDDGLGS